LNFTQCRGAEPLSTAGFSIKQLDMVKVRGPRVVVDGEVTGARPIIRNPENKEPLTLLGSFTLTSNDNTVG
jgi:hypothetical protein